MPDINILIKAEDKASGPVNKVSGAVENLDKKAASAAKGGISAMTVALGTLGGNLALGAISKITQLGASVISTGIDFNNLQQQAQIAFSTMLGDGEKARAFLDDLQQFAAATPFEFPDLLQASQRMLAMGFAAEDVMPTLTAIGDAVAGLGGGAAEVDRVTTALGQMQAKGKASAEEMMQLTEAGIPAWQMLADTIGTDVAGAMDLVSQGAVDAETVIGAVVDGMNSKFGGMMEQQSKTWGGLVSTLQDTFTQLSGTALKPFFDLASEGLAKIVEWLSKPEIKQGIADFAQNAADFVRGAAESIGAMWEGMQGTFNTILGTIQTNIGWLRLAWEVDLGGMRTAAENFMTLDQDFVRFWERVNAAFTDGSEQNSQSWATWLANSTNFVTSWVRVVLENFGLAIENIGRIWNQWQAIQQGDWATFWNLVKQNFENALNGVLNFIEFIFGPGVRDLLVFSFGTILVELQAMWANVVSWWDSVWAQINAIRESLGLGSAPGVNFSVPTFGTPPPVFAAPQGSTSSTTNNNMGGVSLNFYGTVTPETVRTAAGTAEDELRARGYK